jgi:hypothetical protein
MSDLQFWVLIGLSSGLVVGIILFLLIRKLKGRKAMLNNGEKAPPIIVPEKTQKSKEIPRASRLKIEALLKDNTTIKILDVRSESGNFVWLLDSKEVPKGTEKLIIEIAKE